MRTKYKASLGTTSILITILISLIFGGLMFLFIYRIIATTELGELVTVVIFSLILMAVYVLFYLYRTMYYIVDDEHLIIGRYINDVKISIKSIGDAYLLRKDSLNWTEAAGGNCGLFGYTGDFKSGFGIATWYATKRKNYLVIETIDKSKVILTPDNTDMVKQIRKLIGK